MTSQQCGRMVRDLASDRRRAIGNDDGVPVEKLPKNLRNALARLKELRDEERLLSRLLENAGYESSCDSSAEPRLEKVSELSRAAVLALMKCDTSKARSSVMEKFINDIKKV